MGLNRWAHSMGLFTTMDGSAVPIDRPAENTLNKGLRKIFD